MSSTVRHVLVDHRPQATFPKPESVHLMAHDSGRCSVQKRSFDFRRALKMSEDTNRLHLPEIYTMIAPSTIEVDGYKLLPSIDGLTITKST